MDLAVHIRSLEQLKQCLDASLSGFYNAVHNCEAVLKDILPQNFTRIYLGDEFCAHRLPSVQELEDICLYAKQKDLDITLLTPVLSDSEFKRCVYALQYIYAAGYKAEVVVNDWGMLSLVKKEFPGLQLSVGRILNKGFKDPRLMDVEDAASLSQEMKELFCRGTFDSSLFQEKLLELEVLRMERDLLPYEHQMEQERPRTHSSLSLSFYFPFGYITAGRICWTSLFSPTAKEKFVPLKSCSSPCRHTSFKLDSDVSQHELRQSGNAVFYLYSSEMCLSLLNRAKNENFRMVYQGLAL